MTLNLSKKAKIALKGKRMHLEEILLQQIRSQDYSDAAVTIHDGKEIIEEFLPQLFPSEPAHLIAMNFHKYDLGFVGGYIRTESHSMYDTAKIFLEKKFYIERNILEAKHPRRIRRLWNENREKLSKLYKFEFKNINELVQMNQLFEMRKELTKHIESMDYDLGLHKYFSDKDPEFLEEYGEDIRRQAIDIVLKEGLMPSVLSSSVTLLGTLRKLETPYLMKKRISNNQSDWQFARWEQNEEIKKVTQAAGISDERFEFHYGNGAYELTALLLQLKRRDIDFKTAFSIIDHTLLEEAGILDRRERWPYVHILSVDIPKPLMDQLRAVGVEKMNDWKSDDNAKLIQKYFAQYFIKRWTLTAQDYDNMFRYHELSYDDARMVNKYLKMTGSRTNDKLPTYNYRPANIRLPEILRLMQDSGIIEKSQIMPELKDHYPEYTEMIHVNRLLLTQGEYKGNALEAIAGMKTIEPVAATIKTGIVQKLLPASQSDTLKMNLESIDLQAVDRSYFDPSKTYFFLGKGMHTAFFTEESYYPNGEQRVSTIYRFALVEPGKSSDGVLVNLPTGELLQIKKQAGQQVRDMRMEEIFDNESDALPLTSYTAITTVRTKDFMENYFIDFMHHVIAHAGTDYQTMHMLMDSIKSLGDSKISIPIGPRNRCEFKSFDYNGYFSFHLQYPIAHNESSTVYDVAHTLSDYLRDCGIKFKFDDNLDEQGRATLQSKLEQRAFFKENFQSAAKELSGDGLAKVLAGLYIDEDVAVRRFGISKDLCEHCKEGYIIGEAFENQEHAQLYDSYLRFVDLHVISRHPEKYRNRLDSLKKIVWAIEISKVKDTNHNILPGLEGALIEHDAAYRNWINAETESFNFYESTHGGLIGIEEEEMEDDPKLREFMKIEHGYNDDVTRTELDLKSSEEKLNSLYHAKTGLKKRIDWHKEADLIRIYAINAPHHLQGLDMEKLCQLLVAK